MTETVYIPITINERTYYVSPECARMFEVVCQDENYQRMFATPFEWLRLTVNARGKSVKVEVAGGENTK